MDSDLRRQRSFKNKVRLSSNNMIPFSGSQCEFRGGHLVMRVPQHVYLCAVSPSDEPQRASSPRDIGPSHI